MYTQFKNSIVFRLEQFIMRGPLARFLDLYTILEAFGQQPRSKPEPVREALARIWISTLYGSKWLGDGRSDLVRK